MSQATNKLVQQARRAAVPASISAAVALSAVLVFNSNGVHASSAAAMPIDDHSVTALTNLDQAMEAVTSRVTPAIVNVAVTSRGGEHENDQDGNSAMPEGGQQQQGGLEDLPPQLRQFFGGGGGQGFGGQRQQQQPQQLEHGVGSGVIISPDGYIVTNNHVVDGATSIKVTLNDRRILTGKVIGTDKFTDLAVIKVAANNLPAVPWGDSTTLKPGQTVLAFGSPFGSLQFSVTRGIVSATNRQNPYRDDARKPGDYIQTDAAINPGNSGGALVNAHGELVGINTFIISNSGSFAGAGFAIPSQIVHNTADQLIAHGKVEHGYLGISMNDVTPANAHFFKLNDASGAIVAQVTPDSPAARAGVKQGDVITQLNGRQMLNGGALQVAVSQMTPGTSLTLNVLRNGSPVTLNLTVGSFNPKAQLAANDSSDSSGNGGTGKLGLAVADLSGDLRQQIQAPDSVKGAVVQQVRPGSPAEDAGLQPGDVILEVNRQAATSASQFVSEIHNNPEGKDILLLVWSKGNASYRTLTTDAAHQNG